MNPATNFELNAFVDGELSADQQAEMPSHACRRSGTLSRARPVNRDSSKPIRLAYGTPPQVRRRGADKVRSPGGRLPRVSRCCRSGWSVAGCCMPATGRQGRNAGRFVMYSMPTVVAGPRRWLQTKRHASCFT